MKFEFGLCGAFDFEEKYTGGQSVKTREFYKALCEEVGERNVKILESTQYKKNPIVFLIKMIILMRTCKSVIIFPAQNGIKVFAPICKILKKIYKTKTYYCVIGGWLASLIDNSPKLKSSLKNFNCIFVETNVMKQELQERGIMNTEQLFNFKRIDPINRTQVRTVNDPVRLCYFSRITKLKGIEDAVYVVNKINETGTKCLLDIYGPIADGYDEEFKKLQMRFGKEITYKGKINPAESVKIISDYDIQLFPTHYKTEGIPGSILDSYFAGVPVVAAKWNSFEELVMNNQTGVGYSIGDTNGFYFVLNELINHKDKIMNMKYRTLAEAKKYTAKSVIRTFLKLAEK